MPDTNQSENEITNPSTGPALDALTSSIRVLGTGIDRLERRLAAPPAAGSASITAETASPGGSDPHEGLRRWVEQLMSMLAGPR